tara:strand:+ start:3118 stop:3780 length:663 start_codon:yes stop_codon:yes gene_type:complete
MVSFFDAVKTCFFKYAEFEGRASRREYWFFYLFVCIAVALVTLTGAPELTLAIFIITLSPIVSVTTRRLHDINRSGWWQLLSFVPLINFVLLFLLLKKGEEGINNYDSPSITNTNQGIGRLPKRLNTESDAPLVITVGRSAKNDFSISDETVSLEHALIIVNNVNKILLVDRASKNGTRLVTKMGVDLVTQQEVSEDSSVLFGKYACTLLDILKISKKLV